jgi:hypothetical protein
MTSPRPMNSSSLVMPTMKTRFAGGNVASLKSFMASEVMEPCMPGWKSLNVRLFATEAGQQMKSKRILTVFVQCTLWGPTFQKGLRASRRSGSRIILPLLIFMTIGVVANPFDHKTREIIPHSSPLHIECNNSVFRRNLITMRP